MSIFMNISQYSEVAVRLSGYCNCEMEEHGNLGRYIYHLRIDWPDTPLDGKEFSDPRHIAGNESSWYVVTPPAVNGLGGFATVEEAESGTEDDDSEEYHSAQEDGNADE